MTEFRRALAHYRLLLVTQAKALYGIRPVRYILAVSVVLLAGLAAFHWYDQYKISVQEYRATAESLAWFHEVKPLLVDGQVDAAVPTGDSLLSVVTAAAKSQSITVERADYQGGQLVVSFAETEFERAVTLLNSFEAEHHLLNEHIVMTAGSASGLCRLRAVLRWHD